jgi:lysophospholipase L1-like esterase
MTPRENRQWISTWVASPQLTEPEDMPPPPFTPLADSAVLAGSTPLVNTTLRQTVHVTLGGQRIRLRLSNVSGGADLPVTHASVARPRGGRAGASAIEAGGASRVTFGGRPDADIPAGAEAVSDPVDFDLAPDSNLTVTLYLARGQASGEITSHPGSRTVSYLASGNHAGDEDLAAAVPVEHWYFLSGVEVPAGPGAAAIAIMGDSLTDGHGSTTNGNDRWPDRLFARLQSEPATSGLAVLNQGIGGNRVLNDGAGPAALARLEHDVLTQNAVRWLILFEGINDIGTAPATESGQQNAVHDLINAYRRITERARAARMLVFGATLTPLTGHELYDNPPGPREVTRQAVNQWIRTSGQFDAVLDFDQAVRDPASPHRLLPTFDCGDHLHLSPAGYQALADAVPLPLFREPPP